MNVTNTSTQQWPGKTLPPSAKNQLSLDGRVEIDINLALGYLQDAGTDVVDDLKELAYFRTRISIRNTLQNLPAGSDDNQGEPADTAVDTFLIAIISPHLYLQSSAVEQGTHVSWHVACHSDIHFVYLLLNCSHSILVEL